MKSTKAIHKRYFMCPWQQTEFWAYCPFPCLILINFRNFSFQLETFFVRSLPVYNISWGLYWGVKTRTVCSHYDYFVGFVMSCPILLVITTHRCIYTIPLCWKYAMNHAMKLFDSAYFPTSGSSKKPVDTKLCSG